MLDIFKIQKGKPALVLAPMEGITDAPMRVLMTERGGFSHCVTEFLRISQDVQPPWIFMKHAPEFKSRCLTPAGVPVAFQLLGGDPEKLSRAAVRAVECGAQSIDINFGCPAQTVNRHDGGATLLKFPQRLRAIVETVRGQVPREIPVSAKLRLGWDKLDSIFENAEMAAQGGAAWIAIHGRTKTQGYTPPAYWDPIGEVTKKLNIPVIANGEIWTLEDFKRCRDVTRCEHFMIGRGAVADPRLPFQIAKELGLKIEKDLSEGDVSSKQFWLPILERFDELGKAYVDYAPYSVKRVKQWLKMVSLRGNITWFDEIKTAQTIEEILGRLRKD